MDAMRKATQAHRKKLQKRTGATDLNNNAGKAFEPSNNFTTLADCETEPKSTGSLCELFERARLTGKSYGPLLLEITEKIDPKYYKKRYVKNAELGKLVPVPPSFQQVVITTDPLMGDGRVILTANRASKIFHAIASTIFHSSDALLASQAKLMYLRQIESDYAVARKKNDGREIRRCIYLITKTGLQFDEPWHDEEWLVASKAFFAPIHVLYKCKRVPPIPHIHRYQFSPVVDDELPIRLVVEHSEYKPSV